MPFALNNRKWPDQQLGEWQPQTLFPLMRRAALHYQDQKYQPLMSKLPNLDSTDRSLLLRPDATESKQARER